MSRRCVCYVSDRKYLLPTLASARQARRWLSVEDADVVVALTQDLDSMTEAVAAFCAKERIVLVNPSDYFARQFAVMEQALQSRLSKKLSVSALGRLLLGEVLPLEYSEVLYLDGDTQVQGDLGPLMRYQVPEGKLLAAPDFITIVESFHKAGEPSGIRHSPASSLMGARYFNSGVMKFNRSGWIGPKALSFFLDHPEKCLLYLDQDALNFVAGDALLLMSCKWNFPKQFLHFDQVRKLKPAIVHYMGRPKPWHGAYLPWGKKEYAVYVDLLAEYPALLSLLDRLTPLYRLAYLMKTTRAFTHDYLRQRRERLDATALFIGDYVV